MTKKGVINYQKLYHMALIVRHAWDHQDMRDHERLMIGYLWACREFKVLKESERTRLIGLLRNAEKYRTKELNEFERRKRQPQAPMPWLKASEGKK